MTVFKGFSAGIGLALLALCLPLYAAGSTGTERILAGGDGPQERVRLSPDGTEGFYAAWLNGSATIVVQRLGRDAVPVWAVPASIVGGSVTGLFVIGTKNGAYVAWGTVSGGSTTHVQFVESNGRVRWTTPTRLSGTAPLRAVSDGGSRLAILGVNATRSFELRFIDGTGAVVNGASSIGTPFADSSGGPTDIHPVDVVSVAPGELVVAWGGPTLNVRKIGGAGWGPLPVTASFGNKSPVRVVPDRTGGAVILWGDRRRTPREADLFGRRVDATGRLLWNATGVELHRNIRPELESVSDGAGGAIAAFTAESSERGFPVPRVHAQSVTSAGVKAWTASVRLDASTDSSRLPVIAADGAGGAFVVQKTEPTGSASIVDCLVGQRVGSDGARLFGTTGQRFGRCGAEPNGNVLAVGKELVLAGWRDTRAGYPDAYLWGAVSAGAVAQSVPVGPAPPTTGGLPTIKLGPKLPKQPAQK